MAETANILESDLQRFARLAAPLLQGAAARGIGQRAARNRAGPGLEFLDMRDYQPGDDIRHIDWRQSSRRQQTILRRYRNESAADWFICTDCSASVHLGDGKWPMTVRLASALAYALLHSGNRVALLLFSDRIQGIGHLGRGAQQYATLLDLLQRQNTDSGNSTAVVGSPGTNLGLCRDYLRQDSNVFVISDFLEPDGMRQDLASIRSCVSAVNAIQVLATDEVHLPTSGTARLQDIETGEWRQVTMSDQAHRAASRALKSHQNTLRASCANLDIRFACCTGADQWERVLLAHLNARP